MRSIILSLKIAKPNTIGSKLKLLLMLVTKSNDQNIYNNNLVTNFPTLTQWDVVSQSLCEYIFMRFSLSDQCQKYYYE